ncbi:MAG: hypothetical protein Q4F84_08100 [Fibrobacter sp.]|nr:hypothetical protein [Fibrobacter sp.]
MSVTIAGIILLLVLLIIAIRVGFNKEIDEDETIEENAVIHTSGIYSIIRKSPREELLKIRPSSEESSKYLASINEDMYTFPVSDKEKGELIENWNDSINKNIETIEQGDKDGVEFYYFDFSPESCPVCKPYIKKGQFVTREEIFRHPSIIPPFHLGCTACLKPHHGKENIQDTTELGMFPLFSNDTLPKLPNWKKIFISNVIKGVTK